MQRFSPITPRPASSRSKRPSSSRLSIGSNISTGLGSNVGFGNLADELEEVWDPEFDGAESEFLQDLQEGEVDQMLRSPVSLHELDTTMTPRSPTRNYLIPFDKPQSPSKQWASMGTHRKTESLYDGSDYGPSSDDEAFDSIPPTLQRKIHDVEEVTRISTHVDSLSEDGGVMTRTANALKENLGAQSNIESNTSRLITAYTSMSSHRSHQVREVLNTSNALSTNFYELPEETLDLLVAELDTLMEALPFLPPITKGLPAPSPLSALQAFGNNTYDLLSTLHTLTDTLTEHRQYLLTATRKLKSVRELLEDFVMEEELVETSMLLIHAGDWDRRCRERHAGKAMSEVLEGFKKTWDVDYVEGAWRPSVTSRRDTRLMCQ